MATAAQTIVETLAAAGVEKVFGVIGTSTMDIADAIGNEPRLEFVSARQEEAAAHMADGYARATGRLGVCLAHVGPGALRQMYGIGGAWKDGVPILALTGNEVRRGTEDTLREGYHVLDVLELHRPITKAAIQLRDPADAASTVNRALWLATSGRPGPVLLDLPKDVIKQELPARPRRVTAASDRVPAVRTPAADDDVAAVADLLAAATKPALFVGAGALWSGATPALAELAEHHNLPVVTTDGGRGALGEDHPLHLGVVARQAGDHSAKRLLASSDLVIVVGAALSDVSTFEWSAWPDTARTVRVDIDPAAGQRGVPADRTVVADAHGFLTALGRRLTERGYRCGQDWSRPRADWEVGRRAYLDRADQPHPGTGVSPWRLVRALERLLPREAVISIDSGLHSFFGKKLRVLEPRTYIRSAGLGAMGYSFPALLGVAEADTGSVGVAFVGDGCLAMCLSELETAARRGSHVIVVVCNDATYSSQYNHQRRRFEGRAVGTEFTFTNFAAVARAHGVRSHTVSFDDEVDDALADALREKAPCLLDCRVDREVVPDTWIEGSGDTRVK
ncbi:thiamine pyrophosphate-binding protein [Salinactinospora qingdaonensis]|uniref:Biosynthetic-type acetolactate synthase large subunit n=1 Tax=Salinactinospora qingdaonensis TaxID=702744 RepID=A0ABP7G2V2_9ACTN